MVEMVDMADARMLRKLHSYDDTEEEPSYDKKTRVRLPPTRKPFQETIYPAALDVQLKTMSLDSTWNQYWEPYTETKLVPASGTPIYNEMLRIKLQSDRNKWPKDLERFLPYYSVMNIDRDTKNRIYQGEIGTGVVKTTIFPVF